VTGSWSEQPGRGQRVVQRRLEAVAALLLVFAALAASAAIVGLLFDLAGAV
jgi:hypothetical protein